jgi:hypothetical protein
MDPTTAGLDEIIFTVLAIGGLGLNLLLIAYRFGDLFALAAKHNKEDVPRIRGVFNIRPRVAGKDLPLVWLARLGIITNTAYATLQGLFLFLGYRALGIPNQTGPNPIIIGFIMVELMLFVAALEEVRTKTRLYNLLDDSKPQEGS